MSERDRDEHDRTVDDSERGAGDDRSPSRDPNVTGDRGPGESRDRTDEDDVAGGRDTTHERDVAAGSTTTDDPDVAETSATTDDPGMGDDPDVTAGYDANPGGRGKWISAIIGLLGLWMILQAVLFELTAGQFWNDVIVGALLLAVGGYNYYRRADERLGNIGAATLAALIGLWLVASPFVFGAGDAASGFAFWNDLVVGLLALVLGAYSAYRGRSRRRATARTA